jgi:hypothetical protein
MKLRHEEPTKFIYLSPKNIDSQISQGLMFTRTRQAKTAVVFTSIAVANLV